MKLPTKILIGIVFIMGAIGSIAIYNWYKHTSFSGLVSSATFKQVSTKKYSIDTPGINPRVYEFDTTDNHHCVAIFRDSTDTSPALQCYLKGEINGK